MSEFLPNSYQTPNAYVDQYMHLLTPEEWMVLSYAARRIFGFNKRQDRISLSQFTGGTKDRDGYQLDHGTGLSKPTILAALAGLIAYRLVIKVEQPNDGKSDQCGACYALQMDSRKVDRAGLEGRAAEKAAGNKRRASKGRQTRNEKQVVNGIDYSEIEASGQSDLPQVVNGIDREWSMGLTHNKQGKPGKTTTTMHDAPSAAYAAGGGGVDLKTEAEAYLYRCGVKAKSKRRTLAARLTMAQIEQAWTALVALNAQRRAKGLVELGGGHFADTLEALASAPADMSAPAANLPQKPKAPYLTPEWDTWTGKQRDEATEAYSADLRRYDLAIARAAQ